jgi:hypothetical protein
LVFVGWLSRATALHQAVSKIHSFCNQNTLFDCYREMSLSNLDFVFEIPLLTNSKTEMDSSKVWQTAVNRKKGGQ